MIHPGLNGKYGFFAPAILTRFHRYPQAIIHPMSTNMAIMYSYRQVCKPDPSVLIYREISSNAALL
jgi:hypothetical protein